MQDTENNDATALISKAAIEQLVTDSGRYELIVAWDPGSDHLLRFVFVVVNSKILVRDRAQDDSPVVFRRLPPPDAQGRYQISWVLSPEVPMRAIAIGWGDTAKQTRKLLDSTTEADRGKVWHGTKTVKLEEG